MQYHSSNPSLDGTLDVLADSRRRTILRFLGKQSNNVTSVEELIRHLDAQEPATSVEQVSTPEQLENDLHHRHFPKLEEQGLIKYDIRSGQVRYNPDKTTEDLLQYVREL